MNPASEWQRLSGLALVFVILKGLQRQVRENLFLFAGAGAGAAFTDWLGLRELGLLLLIFLLLSVLGGMIYHRRFRFRLEEDAVRVRRGLFEQKELRVRFARVQNIQLGQPFYFRPFGLVRFSLETPGTAGSEIELPGISRELAERMRDRITEVRRETDEASPGDQEEAMPAPLYRAGPGRLFLHGLSSNQVWVIAGLFFYIGGNLLDRFGERVERVLESAMETADAAPVVEMTWWWGLALLGVILGLLFLLSGMLALVRFFDYRLLERGDRLVAVAGLFDRREQTVRRPKVTGLMLRQSAVGRLLGCWSLTVRQTRSGDQEPESGKGVFLIPGLRAADLPLSEQLLPSAEWPPRFNGISPRFRQFAWSRMLAGLVVALAAAWLLFGPGHWSVVFIACLGVLALPALHWRFRCWGWARKDEVLWVRRGWLGWRIDVLEWQRVQQVRVTSSPYQRRHDLVSLNLVLPQGVISLPFLPEADAARLANHALFAAETAASHAI